MVFDDPAFWRAGAISTITVMSIVLIMLTIDSLAAISPGARTFRPTPSSIGTSITNSTAIAVLTCR